MTNYDYVELIKTRKAELEQALDDARNDVPISDEEYYESDSFYIGAIAECNNLLSKVETVQVAKQPTCADRIKDELKSLNEDLAKLADDSESDDNDDPALSVDTFKLVSVCLSYGGPSSYLEIKATEDNEIISVNYRFSDWFDTATTPVFDFEPAYAYARYVMEGQ